MKQYFAFLLTLVTTITLYGANANKTTSSTSPQPSSPKYIPPHKFSPKNTSQIPTTTVAAALVTANATPQTATSVPRPCGRKECAECVGQFICNAPKNLKTPSKLTTEPCSTCKYPCHLHICFGCHRVQDPRLEGRACGFCKAILAENSYCVNPRQGPFYIDSSSKYEEEQSY